MISDVKPEITSENKAFLTEQILTYLGNKRSLLGFIEQGVLHAKSELRRDKLSCADVFSGSGIVARFLKRYANFIVVNDLELYSKITNECYLANLTPELKAELKTTLAKLKKEIKSDFKSGFITELYSPKDEASITPNDRVFYTPYNARYIDTARAGIELLHEEIRPFFLAPLLHSASVHANTSGVFKGFYKNKDRIGQFGGEGKNALKRILAPIELKMPVFSNFNVEFEVMQKDANLLAGEIGKIDLAYLDPPYNQHPYGSNYFMLNLIAKYERPSEISKVSGIAKDWNRSVYNQKANTAEAFFDLIGKLKAKFVIISFNSEGFISKESFEKNLKKFGKVELKEQKYNAFRGSRNLKSRSLHVNELLFILKKQS
ncbi:DNA adenine methylase [Campylobacter sp. CCUG 57310]|uniref:DNA adenine methylase n=1 Tax=Campylobacter sp. CCUG 57310 TaxID=2517362 RepID=UPI001566EC66|nr:DNA adenine methylase [Campylobacter sp. CCUG 57310]QKF91559.1 type II adenine-specific DNA methyltransferase (EcoRI methylase) [Campylobacter sp. CCUG 57310]